MRSFSNKKKKINFKQKLIEIFDRFFSENKNFFVKNKFFQRFIENLILISAFIEIKSKSIFPYVSKN